MDLDEIFDGLIQKYNVIVSDDSDHYNYLEKYNKYKETLLNILSQSKNCSIGLYGLGENARAIFDIIGWKNDYNIVCLIDNDELRKGEFINDFGCLNIPIIDSLNIKEYKPEKIVITHFNSRKIIKAHVAELHPEIECFDIYEILEQKGSEYKSEFWSTCYHRNINELYMHKLVYEYKSSECLFPKKELLEKIISLHLNIKDFYNAEIFTRDYIFLGFDKDNRYFLFWKELNILFENLKDVIANNKNENFLIFVADSLTNREIEAMPYVKSMAREKGIVFKNAISNGSGTYISYRGIFLSTDAFFDGGYRQTINTIEDCPSLNNLCKNGYSLKLYGEVTRYKEFVDISDTEPKNVIKGTSLGYNPCCYFFWKFLCDYIKGEKSVFIVHTLPEIHDPFYNNLYRNSLENFSPFAGKFDKSLVNDMHSLSETDRNLIVDLLTKNLTDGAVYLDKQLEFYFKFVNFNKDTVVIMGDHGDNVKRYWESHKNNCRGFDFIAKSSFNPAFVVLNKNLTPSINEKLFSNMDLFELLYSFSNKQFNVERFAHDYVTAAVYPKYDTSTIITATVDMRFSDEYLHGCVYIFTETEIYVYFLNGKEMYLLASNDELNLIQDENYQQRIEWFRDKIKNINTKEIYNFEKFKSYKEIVIDGVYSKEELLDIYTRDNEKQYENFRKWAYLLPRNYKKQV